MSEENEEGDLFIIGLVKFCGQTVILVLYHEYYLHWVGAFFFLKFEMFLKQ